MSRRFPRIPHCSGTTLIEVLAGLVILSTLLASVAMARGRFLRQWRDADKRLAAGNGADHLLAQWLSGPPQAVPISTQGITDDKRRQPWRTRVISSTAAESLGAIVVRLEVMDVSADHTPLTTVDFLLRNPRRLSAAK